MFKKFGKLLCVLLATLLITSFTANAQQNISVILDGRVLQFDVQPAIIDNRTMVPMRVIFEELGAEIHWDDATRTITATSGNLTVRTTVGDRIIEVNGQRITMDVAPLIMNNRTLVPVRFVSEAFGADVDWDGEARIVFIFSNLPELDDDWDLDNWNWDDLDD